LYVVNKQSNHTIVNWQHALMDTVFTYLFVFLQITLDTFIASSKYRKYTV